MTKMTKIFYLDQEDEDMNCMTKGLVLFEVFKQVYRNVIGMFSGIEVAPLCDRTFGYNNPFLM
jgi:hypothetical protein